MNRPRTTRTQDAHMRLLRQRGCTYHEIAERVGVPWWTVARRCRGQTRGPRRVRWVVPQSAC